jgi:putative protease
MISNIEEMIKVGVNSFKVEGRMRSIYYIATVIYTYRQLIDKVVNKTLNNAYTKYSLSILNRCANRDSTSQFFNGLPGKDEQYFLGRDEVSNKDFLGFVKSYDKETKEVVLEQRNYFKPGDVVEFFGPNTEVFTFTIPDVIKNEKDEEIDVANHPRMVVKFKCDHDLEEFDMMRIKVFDISDFL